MGREPSLRFMLPRRAAALAAKEASKEAARDTSQEPPQEIGLSASKAGELPALVHGPKPQLQQLRPRLG